MKVFTILLISLFLINSANAKSEVWHCDMNQDQKYEGGTDKGKDMIVKIDTDIPMLYSHSKGQWNKVFPDDSFPKYKYNKEQNNFTIITDRPNTKEQGKFVFDLLTKTLMSEGINVVNGKSEKFKLIFQCKNDEWVSGNKYAAEEGDQVGKIKREKKSREIEQANDNIRIALDALNYTFSGDKKVRDIIVLDAENCIFGYSIILVDGHEYDNKFYLNNVIVDTIKFFFRNNRTIINFSGDYVVYNNSREFERPISSSADLERVQKAWGVIYSRACKGASAGEF